MLNHFILNLLTPKGFSDILSSLSIILEIIYLFFAFIVIRQVSMMNKSFTTDASFLFALLSFVHFFAALGLVILSLAII